MARTRKFGKTITRGLRAAALGYRAGKAGSRALRSLRHTKTKNANTFRGQGAKTKTQTKKKESIIKSPPTGISNSFCNVKYKPSKGYYTEVKITNASTYEIITQGGILRTPTLQNVASGMIAYGNLGTNYVDMLKLFTQMQKQTNAVSQPDISTWNHSYKIVIENMRLETLYRNQSPVLAMVDIYDLVSKVTKPTMTDPALDWSQGLVNQETANVLLPTFPSAVPTASKLFNINWKIIKRTRLQLVPGREHKHVFVFTPRRIIDTEYAATFGQIRGITTVRMMVSKGGLADDFQNNTTPISTIKVNIEPTKIIWLDQAKFTTRMVSVLPRNGYQVNNQSIIAGSAFGHNEDTEAGIIMNAAASFQ